MRRRALIAGLAASLPMPAIARNWDTFGDTFTRQHRGLFLSTIDWELNPAASLVDGLLMLLLFDAASLRATAIQSKVRNPAPIFSFTGTSQALSTAPTGGMALNTSGAGTDDILASALVLPTASTNWTLSALVKFDGTGGGAGNIVLAGNANAPILYVASNGTNLLISDSGGGVTSVLMSSLTGWTRLTVTETAGSPSVIRVYKNGAVVTTVNSITNNSTMEFKSFVNGWAFPTADIFVWNRPLNADHVAAHAADPYGTVMRSRFASLGIKGTIATAKKPSLLTLGVGP